MQMLNTLKILQSIIFQEDGQDLAEYALILIFVVVVAIVAVTTLGSTVIEVYWGQAADMFGA